MKSPLNPSSMFFLLIPFFISISIPTSLGADYGRFTDCRSNSFNCGFVPSFKYPFWGDKRPQFCGLPNFQLTCEEGNIPKLKIIIKSITYIIHYIDWTSQTLTVVRDDYSGNICSSEIKNNTFDATPFKYVDGLANVTFLYDCISTSSFEPNTSSLDCPKGGDTYIVYYVLGQRYEGGCKSVIMPVQESQTQSVQMQQIQAALQNGFGLHWMVDHGECETCTKSGGECGYDKQFVCFCREGPQNTSCPLGSSGSTSKLGRRLKTSVATSAGVGGIALIAIVIIYNWKKHFTIENWKILQDRRAHHDHNLQSMMKNYGSLAPTKYNYSEVKRMTNSFSDKLGEGGYGVVYKGLLPDGHLVAVKVIRESKGSGEEFKNEVASIGRTSHVNIVKLLGFCFERNKRVLIYEYMPNGSPDKFIYKRGSPNAFCALEWKVLYQVAIGIARGLEYLHQGCNTRILHLDIEPQNILLDEEFCPKIFDFGLAKIFRKKESTVSLLGTRRTIGFIAPEIFNRAFGGVSHKSDVYSYGMLVLEMVGGRKNYDNRGSHSEMYFPDWIYKDLEQGNHPASSSTIIEEENEVLRKMTLVSLWCIQTNPSDRPIVNKVVEMLEGPLQALSFPPKPTLQSPTRPSLQFSSESSSAILQTNSISI